MQVVYNAGGTDYILAHGPERGIDRHVGPSNLAQVSPRGVEEQPILRAQSKPAARSLGVTSVGFDVEVEKEDLRAAQNYLVSYAKTVPHAQGTIRFVETVDGATQMNTLANASIAHISAKQSGVRVFIHYEIKGMTWS
ncbi:MAG: hypothetical protein V1929_00335 [bacterium]